MISVSFVQFYFSMKMESLDIKLRGKSLLCEVKGRNDLLMHFNRDTRGDHSILLSENNENVRNSNVCWYCIVVRTSYHSILCLECMFTVLVMTDFTINQAEDL